MTFEEFLKKTATKDSPSGDFAGDVLRDRRMPRPFTPETVKASVEGRVQDPDVLRAMRAVLKAWAKSPSATRN